MTLQTNTVKISGAPSEKGWSQTYEYFSDGKEGKEQAYLIVVFSTITDSNKSENTIAGRDLLNELRDKFFSEKNSPNIALKETVLKIFDAFFQKLDGLEISAAVYMNGILYGCCINGGKLSLYRDSFLVKILDSNTPQVVSAEGYPKENDIMILATADFFKNLPYSEIKNSLTKGIDAASDNFSIKLHDDSRSGVCMIEFLKNGKNLPAESIAEANGNVEPNPPKVARTFSIDYKIRNVLDRIKSIVPRKRIYLQRRVEEDVPVKSKKLLVIGVILTALLGVSVFFGLHKSKQEAYKSTYQDSLNLAKSNIEDAVNLKDVDVTKARTLFLEGRTLVEKLKSEGITDPEVDNLSTLISENESLILGEKRVESNLWLDMTLINNDFSSGAISYYDGVLNLLNNSKETVISIIEDSKKSSIVKITDLTDVRAILTRSDGIYALTDSGVYQISKNKKVIEKNWGDAVFFQAYAANIYLLDSQKGEILKSIGTDSGFSEPKKWTTSESENFNDTRSFVVDGSAWVLTPSGVQKFSYGNNLKFKLTNYPYELPNYDIAYTGSDLTNIYLLSKSGKTVSVFNKDGQYQFNLITDIVSEAKDFMVTGDEKKIILLTGEKLYEINITQ